jgi:hypothetical protein
VTADPMERGRAFKSLVRDWLCGAGLDGHGRARLSRGSLRAVGAVLGRGARGLFDVHAAATSGLSVAAVAALPRGELHA